MEFRQKLKKKLSFQFFKIFFAGLREVYNFGFIHKKIDHLDNFEPSESLIATVSVMIQTFEFDIIEKMRAQDLSSRP